MGTTRGFRISESPEFFNRIANDSRVFPWVSQDGAPPIDLTGAWPTCIGLEFGDEGGWLVQRVGLLDYEVHTLFVPGENKARIHLRDALTFMFCNTACERLVTKIPSDLRAASKLADIAGFSEIFNRENAWLRHGHRLTVSYRELTVDRWIVGDEALRKAGSDFHAKLVAFGHDVGHAEDPIHDAYVGYAVTCSLAGLEPKGVDVYNRWASFAGYMPIELENNSVTFEGIVVRAGLKGIELSRAVRH